MKNTVVHGDVLEVMEHVPDESVHLTFTSPPYFNARAYSQYPTYQHYLDFLETVFKEVHRITKPGRFMVINTSPILDSSQNGKRYPITFDMHRELVNMGWEFMDDIIWQKPEWIGLNRNRAFSKHRRPLAYKPNTVTEYLVVYRKKGGQPINHILAHYPTETVEASKVQDGFESSNVWQLYPTPHPVHSAVFPSKLAEKVIEYYSLKGDLVFDPFGGSGTTGRVANQLGRPFFMTEKNGGYFEFMKAKFGKEKVRLLGLEEFKMASGR